MLAFGLSIAIFLYWTVIGAAVVFTLRRRPNLLQNFLLSPVVGACTIVLMAFWLSRLGLRVSTFGPPLVAGMLLAALIALWFNRVKLPVRRALPFVALLLLSALLTGRPMFEFGFNWVSISNDDMTNYSLLAQRLLRYGYFESLSDAQLALNRDMSANYWFMQVQDGARSGGDLMLAVVTSISGRTVHECFMPLILALQLALVSVSTALALSERRMRKYAIAVTLLLCCSALTSLGTLYQLLAQVFGLGVLTASALLLMDKPAASKSSRSFRSPFLGAIAVSTLFIVYSEIIPFLFASVGLHFVVRSIMKRSIQTARLWNYLAVGLICVVFLNTYLSPSLRYIASQTAMGSSQFLTAKRVVLFPYFLLPSGLAQFWGMFPHMQLPPEPYLSLGIAAGGLLSLAALVATGLQTWQGFPPACMAAAMLVSGVALALRGADYGLFKLAMFLQPFLIPTLVCAWSQFGESRNA